MLMVPKNNGLFDLTKTLASVAGKVERQGPLDAEVVPGIEPGWYVVITQPGQDGIVGGHLIGRRFGIYQPRFPLTTIQRGRKVTRWHNFFPGYLFVFVWGIHRHARRIQSIPGVSRLLYKAGTDIPAKVPFDLIDHIRAEENKENPIQYTEQVVRMRKRRKKRSLEKEEKTYQVDPDEIVSTYSKSYWARTEVAERFDLLHKALGLPQGSLTESPGRATG